MEVHIAAAALTFVKCGSPPPPPPPPPVESSTKPIPSSDSTIKRLPEGLQVCVVGAGSWGTTIAKIVGSNVMNSKTFDNEVKLWVFEEIVDGRKLSDIINEEHENKKYLPGYKLMPNVVAIPDLMKAVDNADILVFILPPEFIQKICSEIVGHLKPGAFGISLIKRPTAEDIVPAGSSSSGCTNKTHGKIFKELFETLNFRITVVEDNEAVELCGALKNIVALGAGFTDGLGHGDNTKAAVIRLGLMEMIKFSKIFCKRPVHLRTFLESSGIADLITTCYGGRSRKVAEAFAQTGKSIEELEKEILKGQKLQGLPTVKELYKILKKKNMDEEFPLFVCIYQICCEGKSVNDFICCLQTHPGHEDLTKD
uniref:Glycerol-3-phosphate dehydrogenase [NAD(+)] n=1 Tax=Phascolarctos cinereus TaxID=38626 RepID=A0A6P5K9K6_PHACI|nr:glycerol-3-phosphate dehydrogenase 1-like protein isoform X2 [Phascolarctos cinereus]